MWSLLRTSTFSGNPSYFDLLILDWVSQLRRVGLLQWQRLRANGTVFGSYRTKRSQRCQRKEQVFEAVDKCEAYRV